MRKAFLILVVTVYGLLFAILYAIARGQTESFGFRPSTFVECTWLAFKLGVTFFVMSIPVALVAIVTALDLVIRYPYRRWKQGLCPKCRYPRRTPSPVCPECGTSLEEPVKFDPTWAWVVLAVVAGWPIGSVLGEAMVSVDEWKFEKEVHRICTVGGAESHYRVRAWPNSSCAILYSKDRGYWTID